jgi:hemerythrin-like metal-binding protein
MTLLAWNDQLANHHPQMDTTHQEFVVLLNELQTALADGSPALMARYDALLEHTVEHFAQEDRWMAATGFTPENCHSNQHNQVLELLREVRRRVVDEGQDDLLPRLLPELAQWFEQHAQTVDAALVFHMGQVGYDAATGQIARPPVAEAAISGCGSSACSDDVPAAQPG